MTTVYIVGNGTGSFTPASTVSSSVECWGGGQAGNSGTTGAGAGAGYAKKNSFSLTAGTPVPFSLGAPGTTTGQAGGDTWFSTSATVIANGGGSATTRIGDTTAAGGAAGTAGTNNFAGGGGAGGPGGAGKAGGNGNSTANGWGGGAGGGCGGGTTPATPTTATGATGGNGNVGTGGAGGASAGSPNGVAGGQGAGGGGGWGQNSTGAGNGGDGGDDWDNGGGGGGAGGTNSGSNGTGAAGGTPGGGAGGSNGASVQQGGWSLIKLVYTGTDPDQVILLGTITTIPTDSPSSAGIPLSGWSSGAKAEAWGAGGSGVAGTSSRGGAGGGSGGYSAVNSFSVSSGLSSVSIGHAAAAATSIASSIKANGGGSGSTTTGGTGASTTGAIGDVTTAGQNGGAGVAAGTGGGGGGAGAPGPDGAGAVGQAGNTGGTGAGGNGGSGDNGNSAGGAGGVNNGTSGTGPGAVGTSDSRGGAGAGGGGHNTTAANAKGGNGGWPGGGGGGGGGGAASTAGTFASGAIRLTKLSAGATCLPNRLLLGVGCGLAAVDAIRRNPILSRRRLLGGLLALLLALCPIPKSDAVLFSGNAPTVAPSFPLQLLGNVVKTPAGTPYYIVADSGWDLLGEVPFCSNPYDPTCNGNNNIAYYFQQRAAEGFNTALVSLFCDTYIQCTANTGATFDGTLPFTGSIGGCSPANSWPCWDLSTPNSAYFAEAVQLVNVAAYYGMQVAWMPIDQAQCEASYGQQAMVNNTAGAVSGFGTFLATTFKSLPNIIWYDGNDYSCYATGSSDNLNYSVVTHRISGGDNHLASLEIGVGGGAGTYSLQNTTNTWSTVVSLNGTYFYGTQNGINQAAYAASSIPVLMIETNYQGLDNNGNQNSASVTGCSSAALASAPYCPVRERTQEWIAATSGANAGQYTGNNHVFQFDSQWRSNLGTTPDTEFIYMANFVKALNFSTLVPDSGSTFAFCGSSGTGCGTDNGNNVTTSNVTAAVSSDNTQAFVYIPNAYASTVKINLARFSKSNVVAQWFDPTTNSYSSVSGSPFTNSGTTTITKNAGTHADGTADWVLLFKAS